ncbi:hypothetical protein DESC_370088 [Desulfosarcina cetonica]|nr:hypothetical protein DESC_370088 [Desulfosarcina cetonica]
MFEVHTVGVIFFRLRQKKSKEDWMVVRLDGCTDVAVPSGGKTLRANIDASSAPHGAW